MKKNDSKQNWFLYISIGALMFSSYVGPSVGAGTSLVNYFLTKGWVGMIFGPLMCSVLTAFINYCYFSYSCIYKPSHYRERTENIFARFGMIPKKVFGIFNDVLMALTAILVVSAMVATESSVLNSIYGVNVAVITVLFSVFLIVLCIWGVKIIQKISTLCTVIMVVMIVVLAYFALPATIQDAAAFVELKEPVTAHGYTVFQAWFIILAYSGNFQSALDTVVPICAEMKNRKDVLMSTIWSVVPCFIVTEILVVCYSAFMPGVLSVEVPCLMLMQKIFGDVKIIYAFYVAFITLSIITTCVGLMYGLSYRWAEAGRHLKIFRNIDVKALRLGINIVILLIATAGSTVGIITLVSYGYVYLGQVSLPVVLLTVGGIIFGIYKDKQQRIIPEDLKNAEFVTKIISRLGKNQ